MITDNFDRIFLEISLEKLHCGNVVSMLYWMSKCPGAVLEISPNNVLFSQTVIFVLPMICFWWKEYFWQTPGVLSAKLSKPTLDKIHKKPICGWHLYLENELSLSTSNSNPCIQSRQVSHWPYGIHRGQLRSPIMVVVIDFIIGWLHCLDWH